MENVVSALANLVFAIAAVATVVTLHNEVAGRWIRHRAIKRRLREIRNGRVG